MVNQVKYDHSLVEHHSCGIDDKCLYNFGYIVKAQQMRTAVTLGKNWGGKEEMNQG